MRNLRPTPSLAARFGRLLMFACMAVAGISGCAADLATRPAIHRAGPAGGRNLSTLTPNDLAYGVPTRAHHAEHSDIADYLKPGLPAAPTVVATAEPTPVQHAVEVALSKKPAARETEATGTETLGAEKPLYASLEFPLPTPMSEDAQRYSARESQSNELQEYRGGDVIVISASTIIIVLLIVLLVMLLT